MSYHSTKRHFLSASFSLLEVLIFVTILSFFFVAASALVTASLNSLKTNEHKIMATRYAEELLEWLRGEKETDWGGTAFQSADPTLTFTERATVDKSPSTSYCFNSPILSWSAASLGDCERYDLNSLYKREVNFTADQTPDGYINRVNVAITVEWQELGNTYQVPVRTVFTIWE